MGTNLRPLAWLAIGLASACGHDAAPMMMNAAQSAEHDAGARDSDAPQPSGSLNTSANAAGSKANNAGANGSAGKSAAASQQASGGAAARPDERGGQGGGDAASSQGGSSAGTGGSQPAANGGAGQAGTSQTAAGAGAEDTHHSDSRTCSAVAACGGNVNGSWQLSSICYAVSGTFLTDCAEATVWFESDVMGGSITFDQSGQFSFSTDESFTLFEKIPLSCLNGGGCSGLETNGTTCTTTQTDCMCARPGHNGGDTPEMDAYTIAGNSLTLQNDTSGTYCVQGDHMYFTPTPDTMSMMSASDLTVAPQFVFVKN